MPRVTMPGPYEALKAATCRIEAPGNTGTGYLVSANRIVTCYHVVAKATPGQEVTVTFSDRQPTKARFVEKHIDEDSDTAVLEWLTPFADLVPLRFGKAPERKAIWDGYGYPKLSAGQGLPIDGTIDDLDGKDTRGKPAFILTAGKFEAGTGAPAYGYSGSPVTSNGRVIGHLKRIVEDPDYKGRVAYGTVYAARAEDFVRLLPDESFDAVEQIAASGAALPAGPAAAGQYDVFVSAAARDIPWANQLVDALRKEGKTVFSPTSDIRPGDSFEDALEAGLAQSRAALVVIGRGWSEAGDLERSKIWSWRQSASRPVVPVLVEEASDELPLPWNNLRPMDMRQRDFAGDSLKRLIYALDGRSAPYDVVARDLSNALSTDNSLKVTAANARRLVAVGNPRRALAILPSNSEDLDVLGARALALAKDGQTEAAIDILERINRREQLTVETGGILGGRYRQMFEQTGLEQYLQKALDVYRSVYEKTLNPYPGINTASLLLQLQRQSEAVKVATQVRQAVTDQAGNTGDHWTHATVAEASLICEDLAAARAAYGQAVMSDLGLVQDIAVMRRGARRCLVALNRDEHELDDLFPVPRPLAFVGHGIDLPGQAPRFPQSLVGEVRKAIKATLIRLKARLGVASATVGGDTLFFEELLARQGSARVLLPCPQGDFLNLFVPQLDRQYDVRKILDHQRAEVIVGDPHADPMNLWADFAPRLRDYATEWARQLDETPMLLALWDGRASFLKTVIDRWQEQNFEVEVLYIRNGAVTTTAGSTDTSKRS
jgi:tetratricopeptide (TPR) repeat protein